MAQALSRRQVSVRLSPPSDLEVANGWSIETSSVDLDIDLLATLKSESTSPEAEVHNSLTVYRALSGMTPALAREERIWTRLTHIECLDYARARWLAGKSGSAADKIITDHFFGSGLTAIRDDNAIGRLWWNARIAFIACPDDIERGLRLILKSADIRSNFIERPRTVSRPALAQGLVRMMNDEPWITESDGNFRHFMKVLNRNGGGILFEVAKDAEIDGFLKSSVAMAQAQAA